MTFPNPKTTVSWQWLICLLLLPLVALGQSNTKLFAPKPYARVNAKPINEMSGLVKKPGSDNVFWVHNDSGDSARIFAITAEGKSILPTYSRFTNYGDEKESGKEQWQGFPVLNAQNLDWEDIAVDEHYLYISDMGNNSNDRRDLGIYLISDIDPTASTRSAVIQHLPVVYPEQMDFPPTLKHFDSESLFVFNNSLYMITKHRSNSGFSFEPGANLYRLDTHYTDRANVLTKVDSNPTILAATGADLSPDGKTLAVIAQDAIWLFERPSTEGDDHWLSAPAHCYLFDQHILRQLEAVAWIDNNTLLMGNEQRDLFKISLSELPAASNP